MIKILIIIGIVIFIILLSSYFSIGSYFYHFSLNPKFKRNILKKKNKSKTKDLNKTLANYESTKWFNKQKKKDIYIKSDDNINLHSYKIENKKSNIWVIIIHGYRESGKTLLNAAKKFYDNGYNILMPDLRAHGKSGGKYIGMGWPDRLDIIKWINYLNKKYKDIKIILYGVSMGASTVMMTSGEDLPENVKLAIEDCGYTSVWDEFSYQLKTVFKLRPNIIMSAANLISLFKNNFIIRKASALKQIKKSKLPMLFIHGTEDKFVPFEMLEKIYINYPNEKEKLIIEGAKHAKSSIINPDLYWSTVYNFIKKYI